MRVDVKIIPVEGVSRVPGIAYPEDVEAQREKNELLLLNVTTGLSVLVISCAWVLLALD